jgi:hypothetical protein
VNLPKSPAVTAVSRRNVVIGALVVLGALSTVVVRWVVKRVDVDAVRAALPADSRGTFDLLVMLHPSWGRDPDWGKAEELCRSLTWPRCDRPALELLRKHVGSAVGSGPDHQSGAAFAVADAIWAFGSENAARKMFRIELDRLPDGPQRARVFLRFGIIDTNPDGQAALFNQACNSDPQICDHMRDAAWREVKVRFMPPGNVLPLYFSNGRGHPAMAGPK